MDDLLAENGTLYVTFKNVEAFTQTLKNNRREGREHHRRAGKSERRPGGQGDIQEAARSIKQLADNLDKRTADIDGGINQFSATGAREFSAVVADARRTLAEIDRAVKNFDRNPSRLIFGGGSGNSVPTYSGGRWRWRDGGGRAVSRGLQPRLGGLCAIRSCVTPLAGAPLSAARAGSGRGRLLESAARKARRRLYDLSAPLYFPQACPCIRARSLPCTTPSAVGDARTATRSSYGRRKAALAALSRRAMERAPAAPCAGADGPDVRKSPARCAASAVPVRDLRRLSAAARHP